MRCVCLHNEVCLLHNEVCLLHNESTLLKAHLMTCTPEKPAGPTHLDGVYLAVVRSEDLDG